MKFGKRFSEQELLFRGFLYADSVLMLISHFAECIGKIISTYLFDIAFDCRMMTN